MRIQQHTQHLPTHPNIFEVKQVIFFALSIITVIGSIFLILASYQLFSHTLQIGIEGKIAGFTILALALMGIGIFSIQKIRAKISFEKAKKNTHIKECYAKINGLLTFAQAIEEQLNKGTIGKLNDLKECYKRIQTQTEELAQYIDHTFPDLIALQTLLTALDTRLNNKAF